MKSTLLHMFIEVRFLVIDLKTQIIGIPVLGRVVNLWAERIKDNVWKGNWITLVWERKGYWLVTIKIIDMNEYNKQHLDRSIFLN